MQPDPDVARDLDTILVLHADHSFNASTFACREVASARAHMYAAVAAGVGALSGSLHGGANAQVMKMLLRTTERKRHPRMGEKSAGQRQEDYGHGPRSL
jgi:citrate synthase